VRKVARKIGPLIDLKQELGDLQVRHESEGFLFELLRLLGYRFLQGKSRRWTVLELVERLKNLGVGASRASVTAALAELGLELELSRWALWRLLERGTEWIWLPNQSSWSFFPASGGSL
jgi:hypothetical protein